MELLFKDGKSAQAYPIKLVFTETSVDLLYPAQAMFVAPKRSFKRAHDRNLLKRRMREAYRLNKHVLYDQLKEGQKKMQLAFIYTSRKTEDYTVIEKATLKLINGLFRKKEK